ncbi:MAG: PQQ-dependent sugar dehydrogenase [Akkermansiaceae bacterium]
MIRFTALSIAALTLANANPLSRQTLATDLNDPMEVAIAPSGDLYVVEREGRILRVNPNTGGTFIIGNLDVQCVTSDDPKSSYAREDGLLGIALDPEFSKNSRIYLYYSHPEVSANRLSRFTIKNGLIDFASELKLLDVGTDRKNKSCHQGGSVEFGPDGLLYVSTGDNTNPFESNGHAPIDDRENRIEWDAQRSAGNTNDLRGKVLRIKPTETGYEIPKGNLFKPGTANTRPEIYVMGCRNPFRISLDPKTTTLYWGEVGPDARKDSDKGPMGHDEVNQAKKAGNFGWPFVIANNKPYPIRDFASKTVGEMTDPNAPINPGQRNTGIKTLPPATPALIWYPYSPSEEFPAMGKGGRNAMAGPVFYYDSSRKYNILSKDEDRTLLTYEWMRGKIFKAKLDADEKLKNLEVFIEKLTHPMDLQMDHDGSLILLEYGSGWYFNKNGSVSRFTPDDGNKPPSITIAAGDTPNRYEVKEATDPENGKITVNWYTSIGAREQHLGSGSTATLPIGNFSDIRAVASDEKGKTAFARIQLQDSTTLADLKLVIEKPKQARGFGESVPFKISSKTPPEASDIKVRARYIPPTGHDSGGVEFTKQIDDLAKANQCLACHQVDATSVGPSYLDVALKYDSKKDAAQYLTEKLKTGGAGVWGDVPMPPQVALNSKDSESLINAILGLSKGMTQTTGSLSGNLQLSPEFGAEPGGAWEISAEAKGYSPAKIRIPAQ